MSHHSTLSDRLAPARRRAGETADEVRTRASGAAAQSRERATELAEVTRERSRELSGRAREQAEDLVHRADRARPGFASGVGELVKAIVLAVAAVPALLARLVLAGSRSLDRVTEQGRTLASQVPPPRSVRRRRRGMTAAWIGGGFAAGFAAGWFVHDRLGHDDDRDEAPWAEDEPLAEDHDEDGDEVVPAPVLQAAPPAEADAS